MQNRPTLTLADARALLEAARSEALRSSAQSSIAVVDEAGVPILLERLDGARLHTPEAAMLKARTAAITRTETETLQEQVRGEPALLSFPGRMPLTGGLPIRHAGHVVGGIGVSGGTPEQDLAACRAGLAALPI